MIKKKAISRLVRGHKRFKEVLENLSENQMTQEKVLGDWTVKDVISHLSAWNREQLKAIDELLAGHKPLWWGLNEKSFNRQEIERRKDWNLNKVLEEWEVSYNKLIERADKVSDSEWIREIGEREEGGSPVNINSMFSYQYRDEDHEGGHAKQIEEFMQTQK